MQLKKINDFEFFQYTEDNFNIIFFTGYGNSSFNIKTQDGINNLEIVKNLFELNNIGYGLQIHSDIIHVFDGNIKEGDAIITNNSDVGLGVFTADCVPVIIIDKAKRSIAAIHSGWKGTFEEITYKTIKRMKELYGTKIEDLDVFIGPHIRDCCYEVGKEVIERFEKKEYPFESILKEGKLSLENCIMYQCIKAGIAGEKIRTINYCTMCSDEYKFFSYRKNKDNGRLLSLVFFKNK